MIPTARDVMYAEQEQGERAGGLGLHVGLDYQRRERRHDATGAEEFGLDVGGGLL